MIWRGIVLFLFAFAGRATLHVDVSGVWLLIARPECRAVREADPEGWIGQGCGGGAGKVAETMLACNVGIGNRYPLCHYPVPSPIKAFHRGATKAALCCPFQQTGIQMADLFPTVDHGDTHFDTYVDRQRRQRKISSEAAEVLEDLNDLLSASRALAKAHFGSDASPDHAVALFQVLATEIRHRASTPRKDTE
ncbi:hypothetical protein DIE22_10080 [Burkholderia sp. Bp9142]|nr:hypothetical protein DIE22_10080 [Burkholderia sp. Bp9142]